MTAPRVIRPVIFPLGVAEPAAAVAYISVDAAEIVALDLTLGQPRWRRALPARPVLAVGNHLIVAGLTPTDGAHLVIQVLNSEQSGEVELVSQPLPVPEWVPVQVMPSEEFDFAVVEVDDRLRLGWQARQRYRGGAPPPPSVLVAASQDERGLLEINLTTGAVLPMPWTSEPQPTPPLASQPDAPWLVDGQPVSLRLGVRGSLVEARLECGAPPTGPTIVTLAQGSSLVAEVTPDGRYIAIHGDQPPRPDGAMAWSLFAATSGALVGRVSRPSGAGRPVVIDEHLYYPVERSVGASGQLRQLSLEARTLRTDHLLWATEVTRRTIRRDPPPRP